MSTPGQQRRIVDDPDAVRVVGSLVAEAGRIAVDAQALAFRRRLMVQDVGFPIQIGIRHFEIVQRTEVLLHPQSDLENNRPHDDQQQRLSEEAKPPLH